MLIVRELPVKIALKKLFVNSIEFHPAKGSVNESKFRRFRNKLSTDIPL